MAPKITVGYWDFRGRAEPIRLALKYAGVDFEDKRYSKDWFTVKPTIGLDFPNIPYIIDGDVKLSQSLAILRYIGRKYKLDGTTETEKNRIAVLEQQVADLGAALSKLTFAKQETLTPEVKSEFVTGLQPQLAALDKFLGSNWVSGSSSSISYVDFYLYEYLHKVDTVELTKGAVQKYPNLAKFLTKVEALPKISAYLAEINAKK